MTEEIIPFGTFRPLSAEGWEGVPDSPHPYYTIAREGIYITKRTLLGRGLARIDQFPFESFNELKLSRNGGFRFSADPIPAQMMGQIVSFFETIYDRQHTEAMVLLCMNNETREWRIFIPTQLVSHGGVNYVYDPAAIHWPWVKVGSIHSHCDFGAGHSGIDTGDADRFEGLHCTIGHIKDDVPQIVAMTSMGHKLFHYAEESFPFLFDYTEVKKHPHPQWWERYVEDTTAKTKPIGFELYEKFDKSTVVKNEAKVTPIRPPSPGYTSPNPRPGRYIYDEAQKKMVLVQDHEVGKGQGGLRAIPNIKPLGEDPKDWDDFYALQGMDGPPDGYEQYHPKELVENGYSFSPEDKTWHWTGNTEPETPLKESSEFNARRAAERGLEWNADGSLKKNWNDLIAEEEAIGNNGPTWEELLNAEFLNLLFETNLVSEDDLEFAEKHPLEAGTNAYWQMNMLTKTMAAVEFLKDTGIDIYVGINNPEPPQDMEVKLLTEGRVN